MTEHAVESTGKKDESPAEQVNPVGSATGTPVTVTSSEQALLQVLTQRFEDAKAEGVQLPTVVTPSPSSEQQTQITITTPVSPETPVPVILPKDVEMKPQSDVLKKRKLEDEPKEVKTPEPKKLTVQDIAGMSDSKLKLLKRSDVSHLSKQALASGGVPLAKRNILRPLFEPELDKARQGMEEKRQKTDENLNAFMAVQKNINLIGAWDKHYRGTEKGDAEFTQFLDQKRYSTEYLIRMVVGSSKVVAYCTFTDSDRANRICEVQINLADFFNDGLLRGMTIDAGVTKNSVDVFHAGPLRV